MRVAFLLYLMGTQGCAKPLSLGIHASCQSPDLRIRLQSFGGMPPHPWPVP